MPPTKVNTEARAIPLRSNGQWKIDGTAPLNANQAWKQAFGGLSVPERIEND